MAEILYFLFRVGASLTDSLEGWVLAMMGIVIALDAAFGIRYRALLAFGAFQVVGLGVGYLWVLHISRQQDVAGPYAWANVVGSWAVATVIVHTAFVLIWLFAFRERTWE